MIEQAPKAPLARPKSAEPARETSLVLRIGVSGHRAIADVDGVRAHVDEAIDGLLARAEADAVVVLTSLAEGADRIAADRALARGGRIEVVLPLDVDDYERDFPASVEQFRALLARAESTVVRTGGPAREDAYWAAGCAVVDGSDALLAVWSGHPAKGRGGTAEVVARAKRAGKPVAWVRAANGTQAPVPGPAVEYEVGA
jgi:hypothetical protein